MPSLPPSFRHNLSRDWSHPAMAAATSSCRESILTARTVPGDLMTTADMSCQAVRPAGLSAVELNTCKHEKKLHGGRLRSEKWLVQLPARCIQEEFPKTARVRLTDHSSPEAIPHRAGAPNSITWKKVHGVNSADGKSENSPHHFGLDSLPSKVHFESPPTDPLSWVAEDPPPYRPAIHRIQSEYEWKHSMGREMPSYLTPSHQQRLRIAAAPAYITGAEDVYPGGTTACSVWERHPSEELVHHNNRRLQCSDDPAVASGSRPYGKFELPPSDQLVRDNDRKVFPGRRGGLGGSVISSHSGDFGDNASEMWSSRSASRSPPASCRWRPVLASSMSLASARSLSPCSSGWSVASTELSARSPSSASRFSLHCHVPAAPCSSARNGRRGTPSRNSHGANNGSDSAWSSAQRTAPGEVADLGSDGRAHGGGSQRRFSRRVGALPGRARGFASSGQRGRPEVTGSTTCSVTPSSAAARTTRTRGSARSSVSGAPPRASSSTGCLGSSSGSFSGGGPSSHLARWSRPSRRQFSSSRPASSTTVTSYASSSVGGKLQRSHRR
eukprot:TRINITY_DN27593_c0_g1_i2.p1 TRINITY_DN27593_c0_g1~~TRINITY_DN27593_c0_g1_i2.p1  ORF type:complete len:556 (+),score=44.88 TRINITY_DN27593_c0_g1_i2:70-1737(+)